MKKVLAFAAVAAGLLLASASNLNAKQEVNHYGFITSCGPVVYMDVVGELSDEECADLCEAIDDFFC